MKKIPFLSFFGMTKELTALSSYISITDDSYRKLQADSGMQ